MHLDTRQCAILERTVARELALSNERTSTAGRFVDRCRAAIGIRHTDARRHELTGLINAIRHERDRADRYERWLSEVMAGLGVKNEDELTARYGARTFPDHYASGETVESAIAFERLEEDFREQLVEMAS